MNDLDCIVDKLLDMNPDPIPQFILLKEFKGYDKSSTVYQNLYEQVCGHPFVKKINDSQNDRGLEIFAKKLRAVCFGFFVLS